MSQNITPPAAHAAVVEAAATLVKLAYQNGLILTIETEALEPLAMGNYSMKISVRTSHQRYRGEA